MKSQRNTIEKFDAQTLINFIDELGADLEFAKTTLHTLRLNCDHVYGSPIFSEVEVKQPEYAFHAHNTISSPLPIGHYTAIERQWTRICSKCKISQITNKVTTKTINGDILGTRIHIEEPDFSQVNLLTIAMEQ